MTHNRFVWLLVVLVLVVLILLLVSGIPLCNRQPADAQVPSATSTMDRLDRLGAQFEAIDAKTTEVEASEKR